jgi:hypothetical protein
MAVIIYRHGQLSFTVTSDFDWKTKVVDSPVELNHMVEEVGLESVVQVVREAGTRAVAARAAA